MLPSDEELALRLKTGDKEAFRIIFDRYGNRILTYICRFLGDYHKAEDVTMLAFDKALKSIRDYVETGHFSSWLYRIAVNCAKRELENRARRKEVYIESHMNIAAHDGGKAVDFNEVLTDEKNRPDRNAEENELREIIQEALLKLDSKYRDALLLCDVEGLTYNEAARISNVTRFNIAIRVLRARRMLGDMLKKFRDEL